MCIIFERGHNIRYKIKNLIGCVLSGYKNDYMKGMHYIANDHDMLICKLRITNNLYR